MTTYYIFYPHFTLIMVKMQKPWQSIRHGLSYIGSVIIIPCSHRKYIYQRL